MTPKTTSQWVELIANSELPAITSTAKMLDGFSNDDKSSLPNLSKAILHDQGLSSCLLKVANSAQRIGVSKVTTVSRASVILGIRSVKNICLTAKLVDNLLEHKNVEQEVYESLMQLMANSFYAGMLAKMMVPQYSEEIQEEVYLAAMLYRIGETAFLSKGGELVTKMVKEKEKGHDDYDLFCEKNIGTTFHDLTKGLAASWNLSDLLLKSLDQPTTRTDEVKIIYFADKLSASIAIPHDEEDFGLQLEEIAKIMKISVSKLKVRIEETRKIAQQLLVSYGASVLNVKIKKLPSSDDFTAHSKKLKNIALDPNQEKNRDKLTLETFMDLTLLAQTSKDPNDYLQLALKKSVEIFDWQRVIFLMMTEDKFVLKSRFAFNENAEAENLKLSVNITSKDSVIAEVIDSVSSLIVTKQEAYDNPYLLGKELADIITDSSIAFLPVKIGQKVIGVICAQQMSASEDISKEDLASFNSLVEHLNMCLTLVVRK